MTTNEVKPKRPVLEACLFLVIVILVGVIAILFIIPGSKTQEQEPQDASISLGDEAVLYNGGNNILVAVDEASFDDLVRAVVIEDTLGIVELMADGKVFRVESRTRVKLIDRALTKTKVRILEGDFMGASGWVPFEWVRNK